MKIQRKQGVVTLTGPRPAGVRVLIHNGGEDESLVECRHPTEALVWSRRDRAFARCLVCDVDGDPAGFPPMRTYVVLDDG